MSGKSSKTQVVHVRLPNDVVEVIRRRVDNEWDSVSQYLRDLISYQIMRSHHRRKL